METNFKKKVTVLGSICLLLVGLIVGLSYVQKPKSLQKGAFGTGTLSLTASPTSQTVGTDFWIEARINTTEKVTMFDFTLDYDKDKLQIVSGSQQSSSTFDLNGFTVNTTEGKIVVRGTNKQVNAGGVIDPTLFATGNVLLVKFQAKGLIAVASPGTRVELISPTVIYGYNPNQGDQIITVPTANWVPLNLVLTAAGAGGTTGTPTLTPTATPTPSCNTAPTGADQVRVCVVPKEITVLGKANEPFSEKIVLNAGSEQVKYAKIYLAYSSGKVKINSASGLGGFTVSLDKSVAGYAIIEATRETAVSGRIELATLNMAVAADRPDAGSTYIYLCGISGYACQKSDGTDLGYVSKITATDASGSSHSFLIESPDSTPNKVVRVNFSPYGTTTTGTPIPTATGGAVGSPTPTVTPDPSQTATLNFSVKFQGISQKRADQKVGVRVVKGDFEEEFTDINMVSNDSGVYTGSVVLTGVPVSGGYSIFIKGPKHLAKKFCTNGQTSRCSGQGGLTLVAGANTFDFSKMALEAGDLPNPNSSGAQDGVCNSVDYSLAKNRLGSSSSTDLAIADVNLDGVVNTIDSTLIRNTLEVKYEEDF